MITFEPDFVGPMHVLSAFSAFSSSSSHYEFMKIHPVGILLFVQPGHFGLASVHAIVHTGHQLVSMQSCKGLSTLSKFAGILSAALSQHHLSGFEIAQLEFHHLH